MSAVSVNQLGKKYTLGQQTQGTYVALRDVLVDGIKHIGRRVIGKSDDNLSKDKQKEFWALQDVSFDIQPGDRVGIVGRNGAGKSTLLKLLSRITEPTTGRICINGRVASLLEVGTGFHPELTGRENIFLNGSILGMSKKEIKAKFDEIVDFAEVEAFLDTPVKRYSSGMYVRLAFAVAAHLEPEILIVDEVLAVGDAQFQKKCMGKMEAVGKEGRTILFVSHNMNAVEQLCNRCLLLEKGRLKSDSADVRSSVKDYLFGGVTDNTANHWLNTEGEFDNPWFKPIRLAFTDAEGQPAHTPMRNDENVWVEIAGIVQEPDPALQVGYALYSEDGALLYWTCTTDSEERAWPLIEKGQYIFRSRIPSRLLNEGQYRVELLSALYFRQWLCEPGVKAPSISFTVQGGLSDSPYWMVRRPGILAPVLDWQGRKADN